MSVHDFALGALAVLQLLGLGLLWRQHRHGSSLDVRVRRLTDALALLTDTTQSGLASVAAEIERSRRSRPSGGGRVATAKRIAHAVERGRPLRDVAADEQVSESEIRLHLGLACERNDSSSVPGPERTSWLERNTSH